MWSVTMGPSCPGLSVAKGTNTWIKVVAAYSRNPEATSVLHLILRNEMKDPAARTHAAIAVRTIEVSIKFMRITSHTGKYLLSKGFWQ